MNQKLRENDIANKGNSSDTSRKSIGLENVNKRIKLLYGNSYGVEIESVYDEYTKAVVRIPEEHEAEGDSIDV